ncbi:MAG TPA: hypothetical protein VF710_23445 [Longimicrobium sp.]
MRSYTHAVTYVTDNLLRSLKDVIRLSGLDPSAFTDNWATLHNGIQTWIESGHLNSITLEVYNPADESLVGRWDITVSYSYTGGDGSFWTDTDDIRYAIRKAGIYAGSCRYQVLVDNKPGAAAVAGWGAGTFRSTAGMVKQSIGTTVEASGLSGGFSYYRRG